MKSRIHRPPQGGFTRSRNAAIYNVRLTFGWIPAYCHAVLADTAIHFNYTVVLDIVFAVLAVAFFTTGGPDMHER